jgi:Tol biopolymer transport system component
MVRVKALTSTAVVLVLGLGVVQGAGSNPVQVPDSLVFVRNGDVYRMTVDGSETVRLTETKVAESEPAVSSAALRVAFIRGRDELWTMDLRGGGQRRVLSARPRSVLYASTGSPSWSPDGRWLFVERVSQTPNEICGSVFRVAARGGVPKRVTAGVVNGSLDTDPEVSADGRYIVLTVGDCQPGFGVAGLTVVTASGRPTRDLRKLPATPGIHDRPSWAPDGRRIAFVVYDVDGSGRSAVYVANRDGSGLRRLSRWAFDIGSPAWSPDGDLIAFQDRPGLYVTRPDGAGLERVPGTEPGDVDATWLPRA